MNTPTGQTENGNGALPETRAFGMRLKRWPNKLGFTLETNGGEWDLSPFGVERKRWSALYFAKGEYWPEHQGTGDTPSLALLHAITKHREVDIALADCNSPEDVLAGALVYESRYGHGEATAVVAALAATESEVSA